ncbi:uncharacterized protein [Rutidosis leptorrhynchoides]|uniref:uncharacterized protein n=1 Tax=Rutidosis leptorrhynchoides TaxID=125765 RepID=UPI003A98F827
MLHSVRLDPELKDSWRWNGSNNGLFTTKSPTSLIDSKTIRAGPNAKETLRNNVVPKKVEIFIWRARRERIPARVELDKRGVDLHSVRCPLCDDDIESVVHSLLSCEKVNEVWSKVFKWWGLNGVSNYSFDELLQGLPNLSFSDSGKYIWQGVIWTACYLIWKNRNSKIFKNKCWSTPNALGEIQLKSFEWVAKRSKRKSIEWHTWFHNPSCYLMQLDLIVCIVCDVIYDANLASV